MVGGSFDSDGNIFKVNLDYAAEEDCPEGSNGSNDGTVTPTASDLPRQVIRGQRPPRYGPNFDKLSPVRLSMSSDRMSAASDTSMSLDGTRVDMRVTAKTPAWCDRQSGSATVKPAVGKRGMSPRGSSPPIGSSGGSPGVVRRTSAPSGPSRSSTATPRPLTMQAASDGCATLSNVKGDVSLYVRLRPGNNEETCVTVESGGCVKLRQPRDYVEKATRGVMSEVTYQCDHTFGPEALQEQVYQQAVTPIVNGVLSGYNGAVIAYGQTGSGKTHTMLGNSRTKGIAPRAITEIFQALEKRPNWSVEVSVLEIYNERVRDLLAPGAGPSGVTHVEIHEKTASEQNTSFWCPDATTVRAHTPEDALAALSEGMRRRETARTDMNHTSSRSHLIFTVCASTSEHDIGATLRGRLHIVDLAGSERLKRSMSSEKSFRTSSVTPRTPRDQRREAGEINKSLSQLSLVIQRLTGSSQSSLQYVPYRDSMLTRLLAESFGGNSKTCLIITCSALAKDREETRCSLEFGKRAKLVKNKAEINLEVTHEPTPVMQALVQKEIRELQLEKQAMIEERELLFAERVSMRQKLNAAQELMKEAAEDVVSQQARRFEEVHQHEDEKALLQRRNAEALSAAKEAQTELAEQVAHLQNQRILLHSRLVEAAGEVSCLKQERVVSTKLHEDEIGHLSETVEALRIRLAEVKAAHTKQQHERTISELSSTSLVQEAAVAAQQAEQEGISLSAKSSEMLGGLRKQLESALADTVQSDQLRKARLSDLECQHIQLKHKWRVAVESLTEHTSMPRSDPDLHEPVRFSDSLTRANVAELDSRDPMQSRESLSRESLREPDPIESVVVDSGLRTPTADLLVEVKAEVVRDLSASPRLAAASPSMADASPQLASRSELHEYQVGRIALDEPVDGMYSAASSTPIAKCLAWDREAPHSLNLTSDRRECGGIALESGSSAEPFQSFRTPWSM